MQHKHMPHLSLLAVYVHCLSCGEKSAISGKPHRSGASTYDLRTAKVTPETNPVTAKQNDAYRRKGRLILQSCMFGTHGPGGEQKEQCGTILSVWSGPWTADPPLAVRPLLSGVGSGHAE